jgi:transposase
MSMVPGQLEFVIGVDTHKSRHTVAVVDHLGGLIASTSVAATAAAFGWLIEWLEDRAPGGRVWSVEGSSGYGAGLTGYVQERGEMVYEADRPKRPPRQRGAKSDEIDAIRAARELLSRQHLGEPRMRGRREAVRLLLVSRKLAVDAATKHLILIKALVITLPLELREQLEGLSDGRLVSRCRELRTSKGSTPEMQFSVRTLRTIAGRISGLKQDAAADERELAKLIGELAPQLLRQPGISTVLAAEIYNAWSHPGRIRSEAAFASLAGVAPIPASSGQVVRHRLNRSGDRRLNRAFHIVVLSRLRHHPQTREYVERRAAEGKTKAEVRRCLKRYVARQVFRLLETNGALT